MRRENDGFGNGHANFYGETIIEKFFVGAPPERVVDDSRSAYRGIFQKSPVKRHILRNAIDDHCIIIGGALHHFVYQYRLGFHIIYLLAVYSFNEGCRKGSFLAEQYPDLFHVRQFLLE